MQALAATSSCCSRGDWRRAWQAARVASERGEAVGETVGYEVRFDRKLGRNTRIRSVTEGILNRQIVSDPQLSKVAVVIIDELHERHLSGDLALALVRRLQLHARPELRHPRHVGNPARRAGAGISRRLPGVDLRRSERIQ